MNGKIYVLANKLNGKKYIGQTFEEVDVRINRGYSPTSQIGMALATHGTGNFEYRVLKTGIATQRNLNDWENYYIDHYETLYPNGYNERRA